MTEITEKQRLAVQARQLIQAARIARVSQTPKKVNTKNVVSSISKPVHDKLISIPEPDKSAKDIEIVFKNNQQVNVAVETTPPTRRGSFDWTDDW